MSILKCEKCEKELATLFCLRCKRAICQHCYDQSLAVCNDCVNFKKAREWDRRQLVRTLAENVRFASDKLEKDACQGCEILRYQLLFSLKVLKNLGIELEQEDLSGLKQPINQLREAIIPLIIEVIAQKDLDADPAAWRRI
ncbi:MAG: B-box zinc finger protein [Candidatus Heimdallarchaeota archaeon]|nr:MAG: B-box zinc finger protein [Candidatus Heimdallarchaeota archaeon]